LIASLVGVRRESVTEVAGKLQTAGLIRYNRGHISVVDRAKMERRVCECYAVVKSEFNRLLPRRANGTHSIAANFSGDIAFASRSRLEPLRRHAHDEHGARRLA
jgi:Mn-dependent DtxR family transcriptional regulator